MESPATAAKLLAEVTRGDYTDVHLFSHGWNNVFTDALNLYRTFFGHYFGPRDQRSMNDPARYRPVTIGVIWPSTLLVAPWETTPQIAAGAAPGPVVAAADQEAIREVSEALPPGSGARLEALVNRGMALTPQEAVDLAELLLPIYRQASTDEGVGEAAATMQTADLNRLWSKMFAPPGSARSAGFAPESGVPAAQPAAAGLPLSWLDPRNPIRVASVLLMKDRAGTVGANGVGPALLDPLLASTARVHVIGHSYGA